MRWTSRKGNASLSTGCVSMIKNGFDHNLFLLICLKDTFKCRSIWAYSYAIFTFGSCFSLHWLNTVHCIPKMTATLMACT